MPTTPTQALPGIARRTAPAAGIDAVENSEKPGAHQHTGVGADGGQAADGVGDRRVVDRHGAADDPGSDERCGAKDPAKGEPSPPPVVGSGKAVGPKARNRGVGTTV